MTGSMEHASEKPLSSNDNNSLPEIRHRNDNEKDLKIIVQYHVVYPSQLPCISRLTLYPKKYEITRTELLFPREMSIDAARDYAIHRFPKTYPRPDFSRSLLGYVRDKESYFVLDFSESLGELFGGGERMTIFNDPNFFRNRELQVHALAISIAMGLPTLFIALIVFATIMKHR